MRDAVRSGVPLESGEGVKRRLTVAACIVTFVTIFALLAAVYLSEKYGNGPTSTGWVIIVVASIAANVLVWGLALGRFWEKRHTPLPRR